MEKRWKLGVDVHELDNILDGFTFADVILALQCNGKVIDDNTVRRVIAEILEIALQDMNFLLDNNIDEIIKATK